MKNQTMKAKSLLCLFIVFITILSVIVPAFAHSGRTDSRGGHYDSSTGEYHYHHGYPAHQHTGGKCPYDYDDKTSYSPSTSSNINTSSNEDSFGFGDFIVVLLWIAVGVGAFIIIRNIFKNRR